MHDARTEGPNRKDATLGLKSEVIVLWTMKQNTSTVNESNQSMSNQVESQWKKPEKAKMSCHGSAQHQFGGKQLHWPNQKIESSLSEEDKSRTQRSSEESQGTSVFLSSYNPHSGPPPSILLRDGTVFQAERRVTKTNLSSLFLWLGYRD